MTILEEIQSKCSAALIASRDDPAITAVVNVGRVKKISVAPSSVRGLLYALGKWGGLVAKANAARANVDSSPVALACQTLYDLTMTDQPIPMDNPAIETKVTADLVLMEAAELLVASDTAAVLALGVVADPYSVDQISNALNGA